MIYFKPHEFKCRCGACDMGFKDMDERLIQRLDIARQIAKTPFTINSAVRCLSHNAAVGGIANSAHLTGNAVDIRCKDPHKRYLIIDALMRSGFKRIGIYDTFIHVDNDDSKPVQVVWLDGG